MLTQIIASAKRHKIVSLIILVVLIYGGYHVYAAQHAAPTQTRYVLATAQTGTLITSVTGTGQVTVTDQTDIKPTVSGQLTGVYVTQGQTVKAGQILAQIDTTDALTAIQSASSSLESAQIALQKLEEPTDALTLLQAQNALSQATSSLQTAYDSGFNTITSTFIDLPGIISGLQDVVHGSEVNKGQDNVSAYIDMVKNYSSDVQGYADKATAAYTTARAAYDQNFSDYQATSRSASNQTIVSLIDETYATTKDIADSIKAMNDLLNFVHDQLTTHGIPVPAILTSQQSQLSTYASQDNTHVSALSSAENTITTDQQSIQEKQDALTKLTQGPDPLDIQSDQLSIQQKQQALVTAQQALADYTITAPYDGTIASVAAKKGDTVSSGTAIATIISHQQVAQLSLNEVDAANVKVGQNTTLTFDAIPGLSIAGKVSSVDTIGTVSQGVVSYGVQIAFDTQDARVKPGMTVTAAIDTNVIPNALLVPNSAVQTQGSTSYVQTLATPVGDIQTASTQGAPSDTPPTRVPVQIGASNDTETQITGGLKDGDQVVVRTVSGTQSTTATTQASAPSLLGGGGGGFRGGGGAFLRGG